MAYAWAAACFLLAAQESDWVETRFHRVHLKNGNQIDGQLRKETEKQIVLGTAAGEMTIRREQIDRVEVVKSRAPREKPKPAARAAPAETTTRIGRSPKLTELLDRYRATPPEEKYAFVAALMKTDGVTADALARQIESADEAGKARIAEILLIMKAKDALPALYELLSSPDPSVRAHALFVVGELGVPSAAAQVRPLVKDKEARVREAAVVALDALGDWDAIDLLVDLAHDPERAVRTRAVQAALGIARKDQRTSEAVDALASGVDRARPEAKVDLLLGLGRSGYKDAWKTIAACLADGDVRVRAAGGVALGELGAAGAKDAILDRLSVERDRRVRLVVGDAAVRLKLLEAAPYFIEWLGAPDADTRTAGEQHLRSLSGHDFGADAGKWATWWRVARLQP